MLRRSVSSAFAPCALVALLALGACKKTTAQSGATAQGIPPPVFGAAGHMDARGMLSGPAGTRVVVAQRRSGTSDDFSDIADPATFAFEPGVAYDLSARAMSQDGRLVATTIEGSAHCGITEKRVFVDGEEPRLEFKLCELVLTEQRSATSPQLGGAASAALASVVYRPIVQAQSGRLQAKGTSDGNGDARGPTNSTADAGADGGAGAARQAAD